MLGCISSHAVRLKSIFMQLQTHTMNYQHGRRVECMDPNSEISVFYTQFAPVLHKYARMILKIAKDGTHKADGWTANITPSVLEKDCGTDQFWLETDWFEEPTFKDGDPDMPYLTIWQDLYHFRMLFYAHLTVAHAVFDKSECEICIKEAELKQFRDFMVEKRKLERIGKKGPCGADVNVQESDTEWLESGSKIDIRKMAEKLQSNLQPKKDAPSSGLLHQTPGFESKDDSYDDRFKFVKYWAENLKFPKDPDAHPDPDQEIWFGFASFPYKYLDDFLRPRMVIGRMRKHEWKCRVIETSAMLPTSSFRVEGRNPAKRNTPVDNTFEDWDVDAMLQSVVRELNPDGSPVDNLSEMSVSEDDHKGEEPIDDKSSATGLLEDNAEVEVMAEPVASSSTNKCSNIASKGKQKLLKMVKRKKGKAAGAKSDTSGKPSQPVGESRAVSPEQKKSGLRFLSKRRRDASPSLDGENSNTAATVSGLFSSIVTKRNLRGKRSKVIETCFESAHSDELSEISKQLKASGHTFETLRQAIESVSSADGSEAPLISTAKPLPENVCQKKCQKARNWIKDKGRRIKSDLIRKDQESHTACVLRVMFAVLKLLLKGTLRPVALFATAAVLKFFAVLSGLD